MTDWEALRNVAQSRLLCDTLNTIPWATASLAGVTSLAELSVEEIRTLAEDPAITSGTSLERLLHALVGADLITTSAQERDLALLMDIATERSSVVTVPGRAALSFAPEFAVYRDAVARALAFARAASTDADDALRELVDLDTDAWTLFCQTPHLYRGPALTVAELLDAQSDLPPHVRADVRRIADDWMLALRVTPLELSGEGEDTPEHIARPPASSALDHTITPAMEAEIIVRSARRVRLQPYVRQRIRRDANLVVLESELRNLVEHLPALETAVNTLMPAGQLVAAKIVSARKLCEAVAAFRVVLDDAYQPHMDGIRVGEHWKLGLDGKILPGLVPFRDLTPADRDRWFVAEIVSKVEGQLEHGVDPSPADAMDERRAAKLKAKKPVGFLPMYSLSGEGDHGDCTGDDADAGDTIPYEWVAQAVAPVIATLPPEQQRILRTALACVEDGISPTSPEIARRLNKRPATVRSHFRYARKAGASG